MFKKISNISRTIVINTFEGFFYNKKTEIKDLLKHILKTYDIKKLINIATSSAKIINTEIISKSVNNFEPFGDSGSLLIQANLKNQKSAVIHLKESHITFHTYIEDSLENFIIIRFEMHISSCTDENIFLTLPAIINPDSKNDIEKLNPHLINIDYLERGVSFNEIKEIDTMFPNNFFKDNFNKYSIMSQIISKNTQYYSLLMKESDIKNIFGNDQISKFETSFLHFKNYLLNAHLNTYNTGTNKKINEN